MQFFLKNVGMIKEANVLLDGLTVIAGENDTGKSTFSKALYLQLTYSTSKSKIEEDSKNEELYEYIYETLFQRKPSQDEIIGFFSIDSSLSINNNMKNNAINYYLSPIFIETPLIWNFTDFFRDIAQVESQMRIELNYPYLMKDLNFKLHIKNASSGFDIKNKVTSLMGGEFKKDEMGRYYFDKQGQRIELVNTATGIKYFGVFQVLSQNNYLNEKTVLILDEPEVHLHPKWQLEMAKIIVELIKNGVKIVVNSHSPYMIEALERYAEKAEVPANFYLAENGYIAKVEDNNSKTLAKIFNKLSAPYETFNQMDSEILKGG